VAVPGTLPSTAAVERRVLEVAGYKPVLDYLPVDKTLPPQGGLCKKHKKCREMEVIDGILIPKMLR
jgi:hypothetical protein